MSEKQKNSRTPLCKYGSSCYQTNPDHHMRFRHPKPAVETDAAEQHEDDHNPSKKKKSATHMLSLNSMKKYIKENFLVKMPQDFFDFWDFCCTIDKSDPQGIFSELGIHLVGPFDVLSNKLTDQSISMSEVLCHWRYYYDPPEFQTVVKKDGNDLYHIGYFRDDPKEMPSFLASNSAAKNANLSPVGENIFAVINNEVEKVIKKSNKTIKEHFEDILGKMKNIAKSKKYPLGSETSNIKARNRKVMAKTFNGLGIVVPYDKKKDVGYRPLPDSDSKLKSILKKINEAKTKESKLQEHDILQEIITNVQFANDEGDFGMGLELGIDLFCFGDPYLHKDILFLLPMAYDLLKRPEYGEIIKAHLNNRKMGDQLSIIP